MTSLIYVPPKANHRKEMIAGSVMHDEQNSCLDVVTQRYTFFLFIGDNQLDV